MASLSSCTCAGEGFKPQCVDCTKGNEVHKQTCINTCFRYVANSMYSKCPRTMAHVKDAEARLGFHKKRLKDEHLVYSTSKRSSLLILACKYVHLEAVEYLLHNARSTVLARAPTSTDQDDSGMTAFHYAIQSSNLKLIELLLSYFKQWPFEEIPEIMRRCKSMDFGEILKQLYSILHVRSHTLEPEVALYLVRELAVRAISHRTTKCLCQTDITDQIISACNGILKAVDDNDMLLNDADCFSNLENSYDTFTNEAKLSLVATCFDTVAKSMGKDGDDQAMSYFNKLERCLAKDEQSIVIWRGVSVAFQKHTFLVLASEKNRTELINYLTYESKWLEYCHLMEHPVLPTDVNEEQKTAMDYAILHENLDMVKILMTYWKEWPFDNQFKSKAGSTKIFPDMEKLIEIGESIVLKGWEPPEKSATHRYIQEEIKFRAFNYLLSISTLSSENSVEVARLDPKEQSAATESDGPPRSPMPATKISLMADSIRMSLNALKQYISALDEKNSTLNEAKHWILMMAAENLHSMLKTNQNNAIKEKLVEFEFTLACMLLPLLQYQELNWAHNQSRQFIIESAQDYTRNEKFVITEESVKEYCKCTKEVQKAFAELGYFTETRNNSITMLGKLIELFPSFEYQNQPIPRNPLPKKSNSKNSDEAENIYEMQFYGPLRDLIYLNNIYECIQLALSVQLHKDLNFGILVIERAIQITGECCKNTSESSNMSSQGQKILLDRGIPVKVFIGLRDAISHQKEIGKLEILESKLVGVEMQAGKREEKTKYISQNQFEVYLQVQKDLLAIRNGIQNAISDVEKILLANFAKFLNHEKGLSFQDFDAKDREEVYMVNPVTKFIFSSIDIKKVFLKLQLISKKGETSLSSTNSPPNKTKTTLLKSPNQENAKGNFVGIGLLHGKIDKQMQMSNKIATFLDTKLLYRSFIAELKNVFGGNSKLNYKQLISILDMQKQFYELKEQFLKSKDRDDFNKNGGDKLLKQYYANVESSKGHKGNHVNMYNDRQDSTVAKNNVSSSFNSGLRKKDLLLHCNDNWLKVKAQICDTKCYYETLLKCLLQSANGEIIENKVSRVCQRLELSVECVKLFTEALTKFSKFQKDANLKSKTLQIFIDGICQEIVYNDKQQTEIQSNNVKEVHSLSNIVDNGSKTYQIMTEIDIQELKDKVKKAVVIYDASKKWGLYLDDDYNLEQKELELIMKTLLNNKMIEDFLRKLPSEKRKVKNIYGRSEEKKDNEVVDAFLGLILRGSSTVKIKKVFLKMCKRLNVSEKHHPCLWNACKGVLQALYNHYFTEQLKLLKKLVRSITNNEVMSIDDLAERVNNNSTLKMSMEILIFNLLNTIKTSTTAEIYNFLERVIVKFVLLWQGDETCLPERFSLRNELAHWNIITNMASSNLSKIVTGTARIFVDFGDEIKGLVKVVEKICELCQNNAKQLLKDNNSSSILKPLNEIKHFVIYSNLKMRTVLDKEIKLFIDLKAAEILKAGEQQGRQNEIVHFIRNNLSCDFIIKAYWNSIKEKNDQKLFYCQERRGTYKAPGTNLWTLLHQATECGNQRITEKLLNQKLDCGTNLLQPLHIAALHGQSEVVTFLLKNNYYAQSESYCTPLHLASINGKLETVKILLNHLKISSNSHEYKAKYLSTALQLAAKYGYSKVIEILLSNGANIDCSTERGMTSLHMASAEGRLEIVTLLISKGAKLEATTTSGKTALHMAAKFGHQKLVKYICDQNANKTCSTLKGWTPLHYAAANGHKEVVEDLTKLLTELEIQLAGKQRETALHLASKQGHTRICQTLIKRGESVTCVGKQKFTPIHLAAQNGHSQTVQYLLECKAEVNCRTSAGETPLHLAIKNGHLKTAELLIRNAADMNAKEDNNKTVVEVAAEHGDNEAVDMLLGKGADIYSKPASDSDSAAVCNLVCVATCSLDESTVNGSLLNRDVNNSGKGKRPIHFAAEQGNIEMFHHIIRNKGVEALNCQTDDGRLAIHLACENRNQAFLEILLTSGADVDGKDFNGRTSLHYAAREEYIDLIKLLIKKGADLESKDQDGYTPLHFAYSSDKMKAAEEFIGSGANVNCKNNNGDSLIHSIIKDSDTETLASIMSCPGADLEILDINGRTPLQLAYQMEDTDIMKILVNGKADINCKDVNGEPLLHKVIRDQDKDTLKLFLQVGNANVETTNDQEITPLFLAYQCKDLDTMQALINQRANVNCKDGSGHRSLLHHAIVNKEMDIVEMLLKSESADLEMKDNNGITALYLALESEEMNWSLVRLLISKGASINCAKLGGFTALHAAVERDDYDRVNYLLDNGANVEAETQTLRWRPLHFAANGGKTAIVDLLLQREAMFDCETNQGFQPIHFACQNGHLSVVKLLLDKGASAECVSAMGTRPIHLACAKGRIEVVRFLVGIGADINANSKLHWTPLMFAKHNRKEDVEEFLLQKGTIKEL